MSIEHIGGGTFVDSDPSQSPDHKSAGHDIYPYAYFRSLEHVAFGLRRTDGGPKGSEIASVEVGAYGMEPLVQYWDFGDALEEVKVSDARGAFEEVPLVEVDSKADYDRALFEMDIEPRDGDWKKSGLYDFRDSPPTYSGTVEDYELEEMERAADDAFDFMYQGDEWKEVYEKLASE